MSFMPSWLVENPTPVYVILGLTALVLGYGLLVTRERRFALGLGIVAGLFVLVMLLDYLIVTDFEQIQQNVQTMTRGTVEKDLDRVFELISKDFHYHSMDKQSFRRFAGNVQRDWEVQDIKVWEFEAKEISRQKRTASVDFKIKVEGNWGSRKEYFRCLAEFSFDADSTWRLKGFKLFNPVVETNQEFPIPGM